LKKKKNNIFNINKKWFLVIIFLIIFLLSSFPSFLFDLPVTQRDGAFYYGLGKILSETGNYSSQVPSYIKAHTDTVGEYPPFLPTYFMIVLKIIPVDSLVYNGFYVGLIFLLGSIFFYLFVRELTKNKLVSLLSLIFYGLNLRAYYQLYGGIWPFLTGSAFSFVSLYFLAKYFNNKKSSLFIPITLINTLVLLTNVVPGILLFFLEICLIVGSLFNEKIKIDFPLLNFKCKNWKLYDSLPLIYLIPSFIILILLLIFVLGSTGNWVVVWLSSLVSGSVLGYPPIWTLNLFFDGPIFVSLFIIGLIVLFNDMKYDILMLNLGSIFILLSQYFFFTKNVWLKHFIFNYYVVFFILGSIVVSYVITKIINKNKYLGYLILVLCVLFQILKLSAFLYQVTPAISMSEKDSALFLREIDYENLLYVNNMDGYGFRSFDWILVFSKPHNYDIVKSDNLDYSNYDIIFEIDDSNDFGYYENFSIIKKTESVRIYRNYGVSKN